jgi:hypothetical protein
VGGLLLLETLARTCLDLRLGRRDRGQTDLGAVAVKWVPDDPFWHDSFMAFRRGWISAACTPDLRLV